MFMLTFKFNRKTAVFAVIMAALVLIGIVLLAGAHSRTKKPETPRQVLTVRSERDRVDYLAQYGWEVESPAVSQDTVVIPRTFSETFERYNELQKEQGFDLSDFCGLEAELYTYRVTNAPESGDVLAQLYVRNGSVIAGDVHSTRLDGFMTGIRPGKEG